MKAILQRVTSGKVTVDDAITGQIDLGYVVLLGVGHDDDETDASYLAEKITHLRVFNDDDGKMNRSLLDVNGAVLAISQFTLFADTRRGRRPSFIDAASPDTANRLYEYFMKQLRELGVSVEAGVFGAHMVVDIRNDGPVTILIDSHDRKRPRN
ncbi:MAG: D-aminoacyl-tRNA deacylase [Calditrichia bacterium]